jgi:Zn-dependent M28 family amino/carboxypeptidase
MKKSIISILVIFALVFALKAQAPQQPKPEDILKNLCLVEKPQIPPEKMKTGFELITAKDSITMLSYISSDLMEGRETATRGYQLASNYASSLLSLWKLKPAGDAPGMGRMMMRGMGAEARQLPPQEKSYLQELVLKEISDVSGQLMLEIKKGALSKTRLFQAGLDFTSVPSTAETLEAPVVFAGYGITEKEIGYDDFKNLDVKGKIVLIISEAPGKENPNSPFQKKELKDKYFPAAAFGPFARGGGFSKTREIAKLGVAAILQVQNSVKDADMYKSLTGPRRVSDERPIINRPRRRLSIPGGGAQMPGEASTVITITREMANAILEGAGLKIEDLQKKIEDTFKPASMELPGTKLTVSTTAKAALVRSANVLAYIEGSDPALKNEFVVVGAHLDHLGKWEDYVFNGADDNGSGSVGVLNLARAFMANPEKPKRSILFCLWTGEEEGLLGSRYYVQNPVFPMEKTVAYVNMDMISRPYDEQGINRMSRMLNVSSTQELLKKIKPANFLPVSFSAGAGLGDILKNADQSVGMDLLLREASGDLGRGMGGSDHSSFASAKIPWVFLMASMTDDYHQTSDSVDKVSGETIEKISRLAYLTAFALADK